MCLSTYSESHDLAGGLTFFGIQFSLNSVAFFTCERGVRPGARERRRQSKKHNTTIREPERTNYESWR